MIIYRRIFGNVNNLVIKQELEDILRTKVDQGYFSIDLDEASEQYKKMEGFILKNSFYHDVIGTRFTKQEIDTAEVLCFLGAPSFAYPEPQEPAYLNATYADVCHKCGIYGDQKADFVIRKDIRLSKNKLASLHWVFGELFCDIDIYDSFFKSKLPFRSLEIKGGNKSDFIRQFVLPELQRGLELSHLSQEICDECGRIKYSPTIIGFFPLPKQVDFFIAKTKEFFGSGHSAYQKILVSNVAMKELIKHKLAKQHQFAPCR